MSPLKFLDLVKSADSTVFQLVLCPSRSLAVRDGVGALLQALPLGEQQSEFRTSSGKKFRVVAPEDGVADLAYLAARTPSADVVILVVDAAQGLTKEVHFQSQVMAMFGVRSILLAVAGLPHTSDGAADLQVIAADFAAFAAPLGFANIYPLAVPASSCGSIPEADTTAAQECSQGLLALLDALENPSSSPQRFRLSVEAAANEADEHCTVAGTVIAGEVKLGDRVRVLPAGWESGVTQILGAQGQLELAQAGAKVSLVLEAGHSVQAADLVAAKDGPPEVADQFEARILWLAGPAMVPGRQYELKLAHQQATVSVTGIKYRLDPESGAHLAAKTLTSGDIVVANLATTSPLVFEPAKVNKALGTFLLFDGACQEPVAIGSIDFALRRASNIHWQALQLNKAARSAQKQQSPRCLWFTGLSGSGKSTVASLLEKRLHAEGKHTYVLDGDNVRHGLNRDLGFTEADRVENIRRVAEVAKLMVDAGLIVLVSFISPFISERRMARNLFQEGEFIEVFVDTPLDECEKRDTKGLYSKARQGQLKNFTGIDSPYEAPDAPEVHLQTRGTTPDACAEVLMCYLSEV